MAEREAFEEIALPHLPAMYRAAMALTRRQSEAEDLVQTACMKALERFDSFQDGTNCKAWLLRILRNAWVDRLRRLKLAGPSTPIDELQLAQPSSAEADPKPATLDGLLEKFSDQQVIDALLELSEPFRFTLLLVDVEGLSLDEAAEIIGVATGTVKSRTSRARGELRKKLLDHAKDLGLAEGPARCTNTT